jgi:ABC-type transporter Mla subunit MlaD
MSIWDDVRWNWGASDAAIAELNRMADLLNGTASERRQVAAQAQALWLGVFRDRFDGELAGLLSQAQSLANDCRDAAGRIAQAAARAWAEEQRRLAARAAWRAAHHRDHP